MQKQNFLPISLSFALLCTSMHGMLFGYQKQLELAVPIIATTTLAVDALSYLSTDIRHIIYGNNQLSEKSENALRSMIKFLNLKQPESIYQARPIWPLIAGHIFSNHGSLFISKDACSRIETEAPLTKEIQHSLATAALMINHHYDAKLLLACVATPATIWTCSFLLNKLIKKHNLAEHDNALLKKIALQLNCCEKSFTRKAFISLLIIAAFIVYQRSTISSQAAALVAAN